MGCKTQFRPFNDASFGYVEHFH